MRLKPRTFVLILFLILISNTSFAMISVSDKGLWPDSWPKELEQYRSQARTHRVAHGILEDVYEISFTNFYKAAQGFEYLL